MLRSRLPRTARGSREAERFLLRLLLSTTLLHGYFGCGTTGDGAVTTTAGGPQAWPWAQAQEVSPARSD